MTALILLIVLHSIGLGVTACNHGNPAKVNFWSSFIGLIINWICIYFIATSHVLG